MRIIARILLTGMVALVCMLSARAQTFDYDGSTGDPSLPPTYNETAPLTDEVIGTDAPTSVTVCPSFFPAAPFDTYDFPSTSSYQVSAVTSGAGDVSENTFIWVVYGGSITEIDGVAIASVPGTKLIENGSTTVSSATRHYVVVKGAVSTLSTITIQWDATEVPNGWVAVQQRSEWDCSDDLWSRINVNVTSGNAPVIRENSNTEALLGNRDQNLVIVLKDSPTDEPTINLQALASTYEYSNEPVTGATISFDQPSGENVNPVATDDAECADFLYYYKTNSEDEVVVDDPTAANASSDLFEYGANTIVWTARDAGHATSVTQNLYLYKASEFDIDFGDITLDCNPEETEFQAVPSPTLPLDGQWEADPDNLPIDDLDDPSPAHVSTTYNYTRLRTYTITWRHKLNHDAKFTLTKTATYTYTYDETDPALATTTTLLAPSDFVLVDAGATSVTVDANTLFTLSDNSGTAPTITAWAIDPADGVTNNTGGSFTFDCSTINKVHSITVTFIDACGNENTGNVYVRILDQTNPSYTGTTTNTASVNTNVVDDESCRFIIPDSRYDLVYSDITDNCTQVGSLRFWVTGNIVDNNLASAGSPIVIVDNDPVGVDVVYNGRTVTIRDTDPAVGVVKYSLGEAGGGFGLELFTDDDLNKTSTIHWQVVDASGNVSNEITYAVTVSDGSAPYVAVCGTTVYVPYDYFEAGTALIYQLPIPEPIDACNDVATYFYKIGSATSVSILLPWTAGRTVAVDMEGLNSQTVAWTATDTRGYSNLGCAQTLTILPEPLITQLSLVGPTCYGSAYNNGLIQVNSTNITYGTISGYYYRTVSEDGLTFGAATGPDADGLWENMDAGKYEVWFEVDIDGYIQESNRVAVNLTPAAPVFMESTIVQEDCPESGDGSITVFPGPDGAHPLSVNGGSSFSGGTVALQKNYTAGNSPTAVTVSAWVKGGSGTVLSFGDNMFYSLQVSAGGNAFFSVNGISASDGSNTLSDGKWHLITGVFDNGNLSLYVDKTLEATNSGATMPAAETRFGFIGAESTANTFNGSSTGTFSGQIAQVAIAEGSAFNIAAIEAVFDNGLASGAYSDLWSMNVEIDGVANGLANIKTPAHWGQMNGTTISTGDAELVSQTWSFNGVPIVPADWKTIPNLVSGTYTLRVANNFGCSQDLEFEVINDNNKQPNIIEPVYAPAPSTSRAYVVANDAQECYFTTIAAMVPGANDWGAYNEATSSWEFENCKVALYYNIDGTGWKLQSYYDGATLPTGLSVEAFEGTQLAVNATTYSVIWRAVGLAHLPLTTSDLETSMTDIENATDKDYTDLTYTILVEDKEAPTFRYPAAVAVNNDADECFATVAATSLAIADLGDNCIDAADVDDILIAWEITFPDLTTANGTGLLTDYQFPVGQSEVVYTVTDLATTPNSTFADINSVESFTVTVTDVENPLVNSPTYALNAIACFTENTTNTSYNLSTTFNITDNCSIDEVVVELTGATTATPTVTQSGDDYTFTADYALGATTVTWTITDANSLQTVHSYTILYASESDFALTIPADINLGCNPADDAAFTENLTDASANVPAWFTQLISNGYAQYNNSTPALASVLNTRPDAACTNTRTRTYTATFDITLLTSDGTNCTFNFTKQANRTYSYYDDTSSPIATAPADVEIKECVSGITGIDAIIGTETTLAFSETPVTITTDQFVTDEGGTVSDNCAFTITYQDVWNNGTCPLEIKRNFTIADNCNTTVITQTFTIVDDVAPQFSIASMATVYPEVTVECNAIPTIPIIGTDISVTDYCDSNPTFTITDVSTQDSDDRTAEHYNYTITRTFYTRDACGNENSHVQTINVQDKVPPVVLDAENNEVNLSATYPSGTHACHNVPALPASDTDLFVDDNCDNAPIFTITDASTKNEDATDGTCDDYTYVITRTFRAVDVSGNVYEWVQTITVEDLVAPIYLDSEGAEIHMGTVYPNITRTCSEVPAIPEIGTAINTSDLCDTNPTFTITDESTKDTDDAANVCGDYDYVITRTFRSVDACGNANVHIQTIAVEDKLAPAFDQDLAALFPSETFECNAVPELPEIGVEVTATDNCDVAPLITITDASTKNTDGILGNIDDFNYTIIRTFHLEDACGNTPGDYVQTITVQDKTAPEFVQFDNNGDDSDGKPDFSDVYPNSTVTCETIPTLPVANTDVTATDNCDTNPQITITENSTKNQDGIEGNCDDFNYTLTRTFRVVDASNNATEFTQTITVQDITAPQFVQFDNNGDASDGKPDFSDLYPSETVSCQSVPTLPAAGSDVTATDNCDSNPQITITEATTKTSDGSCTDFNYTLTRTFRVVDACGNPTEFVQTITVQDVEAPVVAGTLPNPGNPDALTRPSEIPAALTTVADLETAFSGFTVNDACAPDNLIVVTSTDDHSAYTGHGCTYTVTRTYTFSDACTNASTATQTFTVKDQILPVITKTLVETTVCAEDEAGKFVENVAIGLTDDEISDNCATDAQLAATIEYRLVHTPAGGATDQTTATGTWISGNPATLTFYEGVTQVYYRITDTNNNISDELHAYTITVNHKPVPLTIAAGPLEVEGVSGGANMPLRYSTHTYTITMEDATNNFALSGWRIETQAAPGVAIDNSHYTINSNTYSGNDVTVVIRFNRDMDEGFYNLVFTETTASSCATRRLYPFHLYAPFDVDIADATNKCPDQSGSILAAGASTTTEVRYKIDLISDTYGASWSFDFDIAIDETGGGTDATVANITVNDPNGHSALTYTAGTQTGSVAVTYDATTKTTTLELVVTYNDVHASEQQITVSLSEIKGQYNEPDVDVVLDLEAGGGTTENVDRDNTTTHLIQSLPAPGELLGVD